MSCVPISARTRKSIVRLLVTWRRFRHKTLWGFWRRHVCQVRACPTQAAKIVPPASSGRDIIIYQCLPLLKLPALVSYILFTFCVYLFQGFPAYTWRMSYNPVFRARVQSNWHADSLVYSWTGRTGKLWRTHSVSSTSLRTCQGNRGKTSRGKCKTSVSFFVLFQNVRCNIYLQIGNIILIAGVFNLIRCGALYYLLFNASGNIQRWHVGIFFFLSLLLIIWTKKQVLIYISVSSWNTYRWNR